MDPEEAGPDDARRAVERTMRHGARAPRGLDVRREDVRRDPRSPIGRFAPMFPGLDACVLHDDALDALVALLKARAASRDNRRIHAGLTYLGQFLDHDITFDPTPASACLTDPHARIDFRTPRLDLDSLYGSGPVVHPFLYDWECGPVPGTKLLIGRNTAPCDAPVDLPRNRQGRALIGDPRNDENAIVGQLHLLFIRFHNAVVDELACNGHDEDTLLEEAQLLVRWHYQWIIIHQFLPKVVGERTMTEVFTRERRATAPEVHRQYFTWEDEPYIPFEFSGAAYRFGHSMVRSRYQVKPPPVNLTNPLGAPIPSIPIFPDLKGLRRLPADLVIDWGLFFKVVPGQIPQVAMTIDTEIVIELFDLPPDHKELPRLNLQRGRSLRLPSGQSVADKMECKHLSPAQLRLQKGVPATMRTSTPLWYYILAEAETKQHGDEGEHLGPVGGRIVAEVILGLIEGDPRSYLRRNPTWRPCLGKTDAFTMGDLVRFVLRAEARKT